MRTSAGIRAALLVAAALAVAPSAAAAAAAPHKVVVLGVDGLDPRLLQRFMKDGDLPNFSRLAAEGGYRELRTTAVPQSPVAWSTFITGMDPGGHGIYDFVHRDPKTMLPYLSMARTVPPSRTLSLGSWSVPLSGATVELLRHGRAFWEILGERGVPTAIVRMPVNFPPVGAKGSHELSGMGTPDLLGTPGTFSYYTDAPPAGAAQFGGGKVYRVSVVDDAVVAKLHGPGSTFRRDAKPGAAAAGGERYAPRELTAGFQVHLDRESRAALFTLGGREFVLKEGEWSGWVEVEFPELPPFVTLKGLARFYLKEIAPGFKLYVSPLQIDPADPAMPISSPPGWSAELCACAGFFSTVGFPIDTKAFSNGVLDGREFWDQLAFVDDEARRLFGRLLRGHRAGLLFFYIGSVDQGSHMLWNYLDAGHPNHKVDAFLGDGIRRLYARMDEVLGELLQGVDAETTVVVMSDHGFAPFSWGVNLNTWLAAQGYVSFLAGTSGPAPGFFTNVDWKRTRAYAVGLNGLYVNLAGREKDGSVEPGPAYDRLLDELEAKLLALTDPATGQRVVSRVTRPRRDFSGPHAQEGPDLLVGYSWGYRSTWENPLGGFPREIITKNEDAWSGDHCIDDRLVPGVLLANRKITLASPGLEDLTVTVLDEFGVRAPAEMRGKDCLADGPAGAGGGK
jgi:predicted AlkP superfamily phosphohydrolase/phosphomutase